MKTAQINAVVVGADRVAANGDTANKIGTYQVSIFNYFYNVVYTNYYNLKMYLIIYIYYPIFQMLLNTVLIDILHSLGIGPGLDLGELATMSQVFQH